jgi:hypothetical protein
MKKYRHTDHIILLFIILAGLALRLYDFGNLMFTFDEFSALFRTGFDDFGLLIRKGVVETDTHPAGVQVFLNYWVKLTGQNEVLIRLPFVLMGIGAIFLVYHLGSSWFNPAVGLISAMFLAFLQYPVTYTVFARPYASGLFFSLLMIVFWSKAFFEENGKFTFYMTGYIVAGALCAYNHYFTLFLLGLVGLSGLFLIKRNKLISYLISNLLIFVLFTPHLQIFFIQLGKGGVESWLSKPDPRFWVDYLQYILHFSKPVYWFAGILLVLTLVWHAKDIRSKMKFRILLTVWLLITWSTAYFYSLFVSAVLQYSVLVFTFPLLVILVFSFSRNFNPMLKISVVTVFFVVSLYSLISTRQHYKVLYHSGYSEIPELAAGYKDQYGNDNVTTLLQLPPKILDYYIGKLNLQPLEFTKLDQFSSPAELRKFLSQQNTTYLAVGWAGADYLNYLPVLLEYYPVFVNKQHWFLCDFWFLSGDVTEKNMLAENHILYRYEQSFENSLGRMGEPDSVYSSGYEMTAGQEYLSLFNGKMKDLTLSRHNLIVITLEVMIPQRQSPAMIVSEMRAGGELFDWRAVPFNDFYIEGEPFTRIYQVVNLADLKRVEKVTDLNVYIWNKHSVKFKVLSLKLEVLEGNPRLYGLYERFPT